MSDKTVPFDDPKPTAEAIAAFFQAYLEILEFAARISSEKALRSPG